MPRADARFLKQLSQKTTNWGILGIAKESTVPGSELLLKVWTENGFFNQITLNLLKKDSKMALYVLGYMETGRGNAAR